VVLSLLTCKPTYKYLCISWTRPENSPRIGPSQPISLMPSPNNHGSIYSAKQDSHGSNGFVNKTLCTPVASITESLQIKFQHLSSASQKLKWIIFVIHKHICSQDTN
jgi:hypothetical protein